MEANLTPYQERNDIWIENLALEELSMEESGVIAFDDHLDPRYYLEESSIAFMDELRDRIEVQVSKFNEYRGGKDSGAQIKIFKISNTVNDFMLFRNSLRLIFARKAQDLISIGFLSNGKDLYAQRTHSTDRLGERTSHEIKALICPFNKIKWTFMGEEVDMEAMVRHYLSEFIRCSAK